LLENFGAVQFDDAIKAVSSLREETDALALLPHYGRARAPAFRAGRELAETAKQFIDGVEAELSNIERQFVGGDGSLADNLASIANSLSAIATNLGGERQ
jgi:hypothetical protein